MEIAERRAMASGFWLSDIGTGGGCGSKVGGVCGGGIWVVGEVGDAGRIMGLGAWLVA